jgi:hypothetical protein
MTVASRRVMQRYRPKSRQTAAKFPAGAQKTAKQRPCKSFKKPADALRVSPSCFVSAAPKAAMPPRFIATHPTSKLTQQSGFAAIATAM